MKKLISSFLAAVLLLSLVGCGSTSKPEPVVIELCDALKNFDLAAASTCFVSENQSIEDPYADENENNQDIFTAQAIEYLKNCAKDMTYTLGSTTNNGDTALVPVTFTYVDVSPVISAALGDYITQAFALAFSGADDSVMEDLFGTIFMEKTESVSTGTTASSVEFECVKTDDGWKIREMDEKAQHEIDNIISCNMMKAMESFNSSWSDEDSDAAELSEDYVWQDVPAGQVLELATIKMAITGCEELSELTAEYYDPDVAQEGTKFVVLTVEIENITKSTLDFNNDFSLYDSQGREYQPYSDAFWYYDETFSYTQLSPNIKTTGNLVYLVPADSQDYYIIAAKSGTNEGYHLYAQ